MAAPADRRTAIVVKGYPRLSETFIAQEILGLQNAGQTQVIVSLRRPTDRKIHALHREITAPVLYLPEYLHEDPRRVLRGWSWARRQPGYDEAWDTFLKDLVRDPTRNRVRRFGQALVMANEMPRDVTDIYAHFLHTPSSVARYAALILGLPWSFSAHAKDIWTTPERELRGKLRAAEWGVTCTAVNRDYLAGLADDPAKVELVYHGLDFDRFPDPVNRPPRDGSDPDDPVRLLSIGRAVEKKGYHDLLTALSRLPAGLHWRFTHIGGGDLLPKLKAATTRLNLSDRVSWRGAQAQDAVVDAYREADLFVLAAKVADSGDRDGLPNVLMEAQATGLPCLATRVSAIPELIEDGATGRLVEPAAPDALAKALAALVADPVARARLGLAGAERVRYSFAFRNGLERLVAKFGLGS